MFPEIVGRLTRHADGADEHENRDDLNHQRSLVQASIIRRWICNRVVVARIGDRRIGLAVEDLRTPCDY